MDNRYRFWCALIIRSFAELSIDFLAILQIFQNPKTNLRPTSSDFIQLYPISSNFIQFHPSFTFSVTHQEHSATRKRSTPATAFLMTRTLLLGDNEIKRCRWIDKAHTRSATRRAEVHAETGGFRWHAAAGRRSWSRTNRSSTFAFANLARRCPWRGGNEERKRRVEARLHPTLRTAWDAKQTGPLLLGNLVGSIVQHVSSCRLWSCMRRLQKLGHLERLLWGSFRREDVCNEF